MECHFSSFFTVNVNIIADSTTNLKVFFLQKQKISYNFLSFLFGVAFNLCLLPHRHCAILRFPWHIPIIRWVSPDKKADGGVVGD